MKIMVLAISCYYKSKFVTFLKLINCKCESWEQNENYLFIYFLFNLLL